MQDIKIPPYIRSNVRGQALWQSAVAQVARQQIQKANPEMSKQEVFQRAFHHPMVLGTNMHMARLKKQAPKLTKEDVADFLPRENKAPVHPLVHSYFSQHYYELASEKIKSKGKALTADEIDQKPPFWFPDADETDAEWVAAAMFVWSTESNPFPSPYYNYNNPKPSVITIPDNQRILILGDFGTGLDDGTGMLAKILADPALSPDMIIHVGDIYYSGTDSETEAYVAMFTNAFNLAQKTVPVFSIPGNHEYYSGGQPFFSYVLPMNPNNGFSQYEQKASFFSLRSSNWQLEAMDTGLFSVQVNTFWELTHNYGPWLTFDEADWHVANIAGFSGKTILFSHHQLYSVSAIINDGYETQWANNETDPGKFTSVNANLLNIFKNSFSKVAAWFWGHEHIMGIFQDNQLGLSKGRLVGNSGYEEWDGISPAPYNTNVNPNNTIQYSQSPPLELGVTNVPYLVPGDPSYNSASNIYNHGFAILQLNDTDSSATVSYYQYPVTSISSDWTQIDLSTLPAIAAPMLTETL